ncbi:DoxX family protein [Spirosoma sp. SC4-14]|uniref:DoxX family protein n=1 Tax=Spirosoma sp. SC4-14 TaxID=3128900 RepID=UPI0030D59830
MKTNAIISWICRLLAAVILAQTLFFKFTAAPESVHIFSELGVEPWGRIGTGCLELVASVLLLWFGRHSSLTTILGAGLAFGLMVGAIGAHLLVLGIESQNDGGQLFIYALTVAIASAMLLMLHRQQISRLLPSKPAHI